MNIKIKILPLLYKIRKFDWIQSFRKTFDVIKIYQTFIMISFHGTYENQS